MLAAPMLLISSKFAFHVTFRILRRGVGENATGQFPLRGVAPDFKTVGDVQFTLLRLRGEGFDLQRGGALILEGNCSSEIRHRYKFSLEKEKPKIAQFGTFHTGNRRPSMGTSYLRPGLFVKS